MAFHVTHPVNVDQSRHCRRVGVLKKIKITHAPLFEKEASHKIIITDRQYIESPHHLLITVGAASEKRGVPALVKGEARLQKLAQCFNTRIIES